MNVRAVAPLTSADWLAQLEIGRDRRVADAAADVVETLHGRPWALAAALRRFGFELGSDGWPVRDVVEAVERLAPLMPRRRRRALREWSAAAALVEGWASGFVRGAHTGLCVDPITGLGTMLVLRLRLAELDAAARSVGRCVGDDHCVVIVDLMAEGLDVLDSDLLFTCAAAATAAVFDGGETVTRIGGRLVVVAERGEDTERRADVLLDRLLLDATTATGAPSVVVDGLPADSAALRAYVDDLLR